MANWITHTILADRLLACGLPLDARGFCIGSIAPDCNVENDDWTVFTPPREVTHWMTGSGKLSADHEGFYRQYIAGKVYTSTEEQSFWLGYYAHLVTDICYQMFIRNEVRVAACFGRLYADPERTVKLEGMPETFDTLKRVFGKRTIFRDIALLEARYVTDNPECSYRSILRKTETIPDYPQFLPPGAISRKIKIMVVDVPEPCEQQSFLFFTQQEYDEFLEETYHRILQKLLKVQFL